MQISFAVTAKLIFSFAVTAKLISVFVFATQIVQFLYFLNTKFQTSNHLLWLYSPVFVRPGKKPRRPVFSQRGSYGNISKTNVNLNGSLQFDKVTRLCINILALSLLAPNLGLYVCTGGHLHGHANRTTN